MRLLVSFLFLLSFFEYMRNGTMFYYLVPCTGDPQTALSHLGDVVLFVQYALVKYKVCCPRLLCSYLPHLPCIPVRNIRIHKIQPNGILSAIHRRGIVHACAREGSRGYNNVSDMAEGFV